MLHPSYTNIKLCQVNKLQENAFIKHKQQVIESYITWEKSLSIQMRELTIARKCVEHLLKALIIRYDFKKGINIVEFNNTTFMKLQDLGLLGKDINTPFSAYPCYRLIKDNTTLLSSVGLENIVEILINLGNRSAHGKDRITDEELKTTKNELLKVANWFFKEIEIESALKLNWKEKYIDPEIEKISKITAAEMAKEIIKYIDEIRKNEDVKLKEENISYNDESYSITPFDISTDNFNILILPFRNPEKNKEISPLGENFLQGLKEKSQRDNLGLEVKYMSSYDGEFTSDEARKIGEKYRADVVVWGNDSKPEGNLPHHIYFNYASITERIEPNEGKTDKLETERLIEIMEGNLHLEIDDVIYWFLGRKFYLKNDYNNALVNFKKVENDKYKNDNLFLCLAQCFYCLKSNTDARIYLEKALSLNPNSAVAHNNLSDLLHLIYNEPIQARTHLEEAMRLKPNDATYHSNYAFLLLNEEFNDWLSAKEHYEKALRINPQLPGVHSNYAVFLRHYMEDMLGAKKHYEIALQINPSIAHIHVNYAMLLRDEFSDIDSVRSAKEHYEIALRLEPDAADGHYHYHLFLTIEHEFTDLTKAKEHYLEAIRLDPTFKDDDNFFDMI